MKKPFLLKTAVEKRKPWGREIWFAWTEKYAGKILELKKGHRFSLQYHERKAETQFVVQGKVEYLAGKPGGAKKLKSIGRGDLKGLNKKNLLPGDKIDFPPYTVHRARAIQDSIIFEVSTPELDDVVKLDDDYGRKGKGNNEKLDRALAHNLSSSPETE